MVSRRSKVVALGACLAACTPSFDDDTAIVRAPRLLAVQATPAEAAPGKPFALTALYVGPDGVVSPTSLDWATCLLAKPLGDPDPVAAGCFVARSSNLVPLGTGGSVNAVMPANACELFGPDSPPPVAGQPAARPTDPDATGGFYLPLRVETTGDDPWSAALERIACQPSGLTQAVFSAYSNQYVINQNPAVATLARVATDGTTTPLPADGSSSGSPIPVSPGEVLTLRVSWPPCPATATACGGAETYVYIDPTSRQLATSRESMVSSWYATGGSFALDRVGRAVSDLATSADNHWTAPSAKGPAHVWIVLRDARGGVGWASYTFDVE